MKNYNNVKEFISDLIDNEGDIFSDNYGRHWKYEKFKFIHKDLGVNTWTDGLFCLHLYGTEIHKQLADNSEEG